MECYESAVIGAGMFGSSVAKYMSAETKSCVLIGPQRPLNGTYAAWFDEGRIAESLDHKTNWKILGG